jgi:hypothetical protein
MFDPCMVSLSNHQSPHRDWSDGVVESECLWPRPAWVHPEVSGSFSLRSVYLRCTFSTENSRFTPWQTTQLSLPTAATCASM